ncbi:MAG: phenylacetate--CoA ligase family protein, partial [Candidatus Lokiarchaeia archaeon]
MRDEDEYWNPIMETMRRSELEELQWKKIKSIITYAYRNSPFYHEMFSKEGIKPEDIKTKEEFQNKIPLFRKDKVRKLRAETGDPFAKMLTVPYEVLASFHTSTGTTGVPTFTALSENDIKAATEPLTRIGWMWKIRPAMRLLCAAMLDGFWHWWSVFLGHCVLTNLGVNSQLITYNFLIPLFGLPTSKTALGKFRADWVLFTHASALAVLNECTRLGVEPKEIIPGVKYACSAGEAASTHQRETFLEKFGTLDWFGGWGCSDPYTMTSDCYAHIGYHVFLDYWSLELVDPETDELLPPGERGEIVSTNLWQESLPYVRFGTEDFGELVDESCECGRTHPMVRVFDR